MVDGIRSGGSLAHEAIKAARQRQAEMAERLQEAAARLEGGAGEVDKQNEFRSTLAEGISELNQQVQLGDDLVERIVSGEVTEVHEVAAQIKEADLSFKFALRVRNKLIDAYREVMRMNV